VHVQPPPEYIQLPPEIEYVQAPPQYVTLPPQIIDVQLPPTYVNAPREVVHVQAPPQIIEAPREVITVQPPPIVQQQVMYQQPVYQQQFAVAAPAPNLHVTEPVHVSRKNAVKGDVAYMPHVGSVSQVKGTVRGPGYGYY